MRRIRLAPLVLPVLMVASAPLLLAGCPAAPPASSVPAPPATPRAVLTPALAEVAVGEELRLARLNEEWIYRVIEVGAADVRVELLKMVDGHAAGEPATIIWDRKGFGVPDDAVILRIEPTTRGVGGSKAAGDGRTQGGKERPCWLLYVALPDGHFYYWVTDEVAVHGVLAIAREHKGRPDETHAMEWVYDSESGW